jgi:hypothetical protein
VTRPASEVEAVLKLVAEGLNDCAISRATGIPRVTIREWRIYGGQRRPGTRRVRRSDCPLCDGADIDAEWYAYLLGLYLGDGCLNECARKVFKLRVVLDLRYPQIIAECAEAMVAVRTGARGRVCYSYSTGCVYVTGYWKHWPCLFPQHGPGPKHKRPIVLRHWQEEIVSANPDRLLRGLIHSDGSRDLNRVNGKSYPRYQFTNHSEDIRKIFCQACDDFGIRYTRPSWRVISISKRPEVGKLDTIIGPKR